MTAKLREINNRDLSRLVRTHAILAIKEPRVVFTDKYLAFEDDTPKKYKERISSSIEMFCPPDANAYLLGTVTSVQKTLVFAVQYYNIQK